MPKKITYDFVKKYVLENSNCQLMSNDYINNSSKLEFKCGCGNIFETSFAKFKDRKKRQCNECGFALRGQYQSKTPEEFREEVQNIVGNEYIVLGYYSGAVEKIKFRHNSCGNEYLAAPHDFLSGKRCPKCRRPRYNTTTDEFKKIIKELTNGEYDVVGEYTSSHTHIRLKHNLCGTEYKVTPNNFTSHGRRCPNYDCHIRRVGGINHHAYNPDLTDEERINRRDLKENIKWRKSVYRKDGYKCVSCGDDQGRNLVAHHLDGYNWCVEKRFDVKNGVTLCEICHKAFHHNYGYGNNTKEQFQEFISRN
ncbi:conserved hypothetical protein [Alkaliphilus metalliredigens QYMF]|uniref:HNH nuclease domain-containing protein n=1 Tax=Alkaliphilus metalliredigens (strain QYMF) TaxID=293826 RepID=A6TQW0_ALKMQ|nr:HNH endonuclease [Alkaliphilus metalliredigens]ABR48578.1 conserved hypothetical protein [Alkaliphilus metalliredigens QYMF]